MTPFAAMHRRQAQMRRNDMLIRAAVILAAWGLGLGMGVMM